MTKKIIKKDNAIIKKDNNSLSKKRHTKVDITKVDYTKVEVAPKNQSKNFFSKGNAYKEFIKFIVSRGMSEPAALKETEKFISYWTERNQAGTKERWQMEKTFEIKRRLSTWFQRSQEFSSKKRTII